jgi:hypothetical protein
MPKNKNSEIAEELDPHVNTSYENLQDAVHGVDEPMDDSHPTSTGGMVYGAYPLLLLIAVVGALAFAGLRKFF